jgi:hypothetical protein
MKSSQSQLFGNHIFSSCLNYYLKIIPLKSFRNLVVAKFGVKGEKLKDIFYLLDDIASLPG